MREGNRETISAIAGESALMHNGVQEGSLVETLQAGLIGQIQRLPKLPERYRAVDF
jgi:hypothetical protein